MRKKAPKLRKGEKLYGATFTVTGRAHALIAARSEEEARAIAKSFEVDGDLIEWEYDELEDVQAVGE